MDITTKLGQVEEEGLHGVSQDQDINQSPMCKYRGHDSKTGLWTVECAGSAWMQGKVSKLVKAA